MSGASATGSTAIAGGDHSTNSKHYRGKAFDIDTINGVRVGSGAAHSAFMAACRAYGADEVLGPGDAGTPRTSTVAGTD